MPLPVIANVFRTSLEWSDGGSLRATNVLHFLAPGKTAGDVNTIVDNHATVNMWYTTWSGLGVDEVITLPLDGSSSHAVLATGRPAKWVGGSGGQPILELATIVKLATAFRGRSYRGRVYVPMSSEANVDGGITDPTARAAMTAAWTTFANACSTDGAALVVASYHLAVANQVINLGAEPVQGVQRRRQAQLR